METLPFSVWCNSVCNFDAGLCHHILTFRHKNQVQTTRKAQSTTQKQAPPIHLRTNVFTKKIDMLKIPMCLDYKHWKIGQFSQNHLYIFFTRIASIFNTNSLDFWFPTRLYEHLYTWNIKGLSASPEKSRYRKFYTNCGHPSPSLLKGIWQHHWYVMHFDQILFRIWMSSSNGNKSAVSLTRRT